MELFKSIDEMKQMTNEETITYSCALMNRKVAIANIALAGNKIEQAEKEEADKISKQLELLKDARKSANS